MLRNADEIEGIFLDFFGTLAAGDREAVHDICQCIVDDLALPTTVEKLAIHWGDRFFAAIDACNGARFRSLYVCECESLAMTLADFGVRTDPAPYVNRLRSYWRQPPLHDEVFEVLRALPRPVCIVSNVDHDDLNAALSAHGIGVDHVMTSEQAQAYKPHEGIFEHALNETGWNRARVLHVGDSLHSDVAGARRCGLHTAWVNRASRIHDIGNGQADVAFPDLRGLVKLFTA